MKKEENIKIRVVDSNNHNELKEMEETIEILFEILKEEHKKVNLLYTIVSLLVFAVGVLEVGG